MENSPDANIRELGRRLVIPKNYDEYYEYSKAAIDTGMYASLGTKPWDEELEFGTWYRSRDLLTADLPYGQHLLNKKWPLTKERNLHLVFDKNKT